MNVQEINSSGHNVWVFVVSALVLVFLTLLTWAGSYLSMRWKQMGAEGRTNTVKDLDRKLSDLKEKINPAVRMRSWRTVRRPTGSDIISQRQSSERFDENSFGGAVDYDSRGGRNPHPVEIEL